MRYHTNIISIVYLLQIQMRSKGNQIYLEKGWVRYSISLYAAPILFVHNADKIERMYIDYRVINNKLRRITIRYHGQITFMTSYQLHITLAKLIYPRVTIKLQQHLVMNISQPLSYNINCFEFIMLLFELYNALRTFQILVNATFQHELYDFVLVYLDTFQ